MSSPRPTGSRRAGWRFRAARANARSATATIATGSSGPSAAGRISATRAPPRRTGPGGAPRGGEVEPTYSFFHLARLPPPELGGGNLAPEETRAGKESASTYKIRGYTSTKNKKQ